VPRPRVAVVLSLVFAVFLISAPTAVAKPAEGTQSGCAKTAESGTKQTFRCRYGPVTVAPFAVRQEFVFSNVPKPAVDGKIVSMSTDVTDKNGKPMPIRRLMLHHIVFAKLGAKDNTCDSFMTWDTRTSLPAAAQRFYGAGEERAKFLVPQGYGYPTKGSESWMMVWMFMNHRGVSDTAWITYDVTIDTAPDLTDVQPYWLDVRNCNADPVYDLPGGGKKGATSTEQSDFTFPTAGRIVAGGGHVHGGARQLTLTEPGCSGRRIAQSDPIWGKGSDPFYNVKPVLHEPGPISMSGFNSPTGIPIAAGETVRLNSTYDNTRPHTRVMGIYVVYLAPDAGVSSACGALPGDMVYAQNRTDGRSTPPPFRIPLTGVKDGKAVKIDRPPGRTRVLSGNGKIAVGDSFFTQPNVSIPQGASLTWTFGKPKSPTLLHNVTLANGPQGFSSPNLDIGRSYSKTFTQPGTYEYFCALHPVDMTATVTVRAKGK
jgi:plastocyanin